MQPRNKVLFLLIGLGLASTVSIFLPGGPEADIWGNLARDTYIGRINNGHREFEKASRIIKADPDIDITIKIPMEVRIVGDRSMLPRPHNANPNARGCAERSNRITVIGKRVNGWIVVNQAVVGHEVCHLMNWQNPELANPDILEKLF